MSSYPHAQSILDLMTNKPAEDDIAGYHGSNTRAILMMAIGGLLPPGINPPGKIFYSPTQSGIGDLLGNAVARQHNEIDTNSLEEAAHYASIQEGNVYLTEKFGPIIKKLCKTSYIGLFESATDSPLEVLKGECGELADGLYTYLKGLFYSDEEIMELMSSIAKERKGVLLTFRRSVCELAKYDDKEGVLHEGIHVPTHKGLDLNHIASITPLGPKERDVLGVLSHS